MKHYKRFKKAFGIDDYGMIAFPNKISNVKISRIQNTDKVGGCSYCFPHGIECTNSKWNKRTRNWKTYRRFQYKSQVFIENTGTEILIYNGFVGGVEYDIEQQLYYGKILNCNDLVSYEANNKQQLNKAFIEAVLDYGLMLSMLKVNRCDTVSRIDVMQVLENKK